MKILTSLDYRYKQILSDCFLSTLPQCELTMEYINRDIKECEGKFGSHDTLYKIPFILKEMEKCKEGERLIYSDVDIVFLNKNIIDIVNNLQGADMYIQWDRPDGTVCLGFMVIINNENSRNYLRKFLEVDVDYIIKNFGFSLMYFKHLKEKYSWNIKSLPMEFYGGQMEHYNIPQPSEIYLYHATYQPTMEAKYNKLKSFI